MSITVNEVKSRYPIHWLVWNNQHEELLSSLEDKKFSNEDLEVKDPRGRTPLLLAVTLGHTETVRVLIDAGADVNCEKDGWTAVQEATATGNTELLSLVLSKRDYQRHMVRTGGIPDLLRKLSLAPDFYVEMKWEFTSWVPLVSRMCPFDTYKLYKRGGNVRVDTTLIGFENNRWQRGDRTYIFRGHGTSASLVELDHELGTSWCEHLEPLQPEAHAWPKPPGHALKARCAAPLAINYLDTDKISFERNKSGIWGWRQDKTETVNGYECKVFSANNVELVSKTRTEHLPRGPRRQTPKAPLAGLLALADRDSEPSTPTEPLLSPDREEATQPPRSKSSEDLKPVTWEEYFSQAPLDRDIGKPKEINTKVQKFRANLWLCEDYPLELQEQIMPILDLMAAMSSPHFAKLKDFIQMQLPAGFPVKIEIPLFHVLNARITFGNIFGRESPTAHVECVAEGTRAACLVDDACFAVGRGYRDAAAPALASLTDDEEGLLQYAIQQSLMEAGTHDDQVDVWEALRGARSSSPVPPRSRASPQELLAHEERQLQSYRSRRVSPRQLHVLWEYLNLNKDIASAHNRSLDAKSYSQRKWSALTETLNSIGDGVHKDWKGWSKCTGSAIDEIGSPASSLPNTSTVSGVQDSSTSMVVDSVLPHSPCITRTPSPDPLSTSTPVPRTVAAAAATFVPRTVAAAAATFVPRTVAAAAATFVPRTVAAAAATFVPRTVAAAAATFVPGTVAAAAEVRQAPRRRRRRQQPMSQEAARRALVESSQLRAEAAVRSSAALERISQTMEQIYNTLQRIERAIEASLAAMSAMSVGPPTPSGEREAESADDELAAALALSAREQARRQQQLEDEQKQLAEALRLSLLDK